MSMTRFAPLSAPRAWASSLDIGSHANVTRGEPFVPFAVPIQNLAARPRGGSAIALSAAVTADGASGFGGAVARATS